MKPTDNIFALSDTERETVEEQVALAEKMLPLIAALITAFKKGETSMLKLVNDLELTRSLFGEVSEKLQSTVRQ